MHTATTTQRHERERPKPPLVREIERRYQAQRAKDEQFRASVRASARSRTGRTR